MHARMRGPAQEKLPEQLPAACEQQAKARRGERVDKGASDQDPTAQEISMTWSNQVP